MRATKRKRGGGRPHSDEKRASAALMCAQGMTNAEIATELRIQRNTLIKWRKDPSFVEDIDTIHREVREAATNRLKALTGMAVDTLVQLMGRTDEAPTQRGAALDILKLVGMQPPEELRVIGDGLAMTQADRAAVFALAAKVLSGDPPTED